MALLTDDEDIRDVRMWMEYGGNGDYYINLQEKRLLFDKPDLRRINMRIAMSGGNAPHEVRMAVAALYRAMQAAGLNEHPATDEANENKGNAAGEP